MGIAGLCIEKSHKRSRSNFAFIQNFLERSWRRTKMHFSVQIFLLLLLLESHLRFLRLLYLLKSEYKKKLHPDLIRQHCKKMIFTLTFVKYILGLVDLIILQKRQLIIIFFSDQIQQRFYVKVSSQFSSYIVGLAYHVL